MSYAVALLIIVLAIVAATVVSLAAGRVPIEERRRYHEVGSPVFSQVGVMLSILLAFVFSDVWGEYNTAAQAISDECGALHGAAMLARALPGQEGAPLVAAIQRYADVVATREWPSMSERKRSAQAIGAAAAMLSQAARLGASQPANAGLNSAVLGLLSTAHAARETRLFQMTQALPPFLWSMLIVISTTLVLFVAFSGVERPGRLLFVAVFAGAIALILVAVRMLDYPFEGALALPATDFNVLVSELHALV